MPPCPPVAFVYTIRARSASQTPCLFKQVEVPFVGFLIWHILKVYMECVVIEFFRVMSTVLHTPLVFILFTTRCILNAQFVGSNGFYSVYRRICFPSGTSCHSFAFRQSSREFTLVRLYLNVKQVEDSENIYGVLSVFVKALPYTHINLPYKLQFISLQLSESPK